MLKKFEPKIDVIKAVWGFKWVIKLYVFKKLVIRIWNVFSNVISSTLFVLSIIWV